MAFVLCLALIAIILLVAVMIVFFFMNKRNIVRTVTGNSTTSMHVILLLIGILLFAFVLYAVFCFLSAANTSHGSVGVISLPLDEYLQEVDAQQIREWLDENVNDEKKAYILKHREDFKDNAKVNYLICLPYNIDNRRISVDQSTNLFGETVTLSFEKTDQDMDRTAVLVTYEGDSHVKLKIHYDGHEMEHLVSEVDYSLELPLDI